MKKKIFYTLFLASLVSSCSSIKNTDVNDYKDMRNALNDYLKTEIKDSNKKIIIVTEKLNSNETIEVFKGDSIVYSPTQIVREGGVNLSLYKEKDWITMKNKYYKKSTEEGLLKNDYWQEGDFIVNNVILLSDQKLRDNSNGKEIGIDISGKDVYIFSEPIYYRTKKILTFMVSTGRIPIFEMDHYLIVMKNENKKWVEIDRAYPHKVR